MQQDLTPKQQTSESIRQAETILITTGQHPSVDQVTAVLSLAAVLRKFGKKISVVISDPLPAQVGFLDSSMVSQSLSGLRDFIIKLDLAKTEVDKLRYEVEEGKLNVYITPFQGGFAERDVSFGYGDYHFDLAIVLGVPTHARIDRVYADNQSLFNTIPVLNLDYHRSNENFGAVNLIESTASSLCEILVALSESLQTGLIDADIATIMLTGLISSTDRFTASHTTSKSLTVGAQLMAAGARQQAVIKGLYRDNRDSSDRQPARSDAQERSPRPDNRPQQQSRPDNRPQPRSDNRPQSQGQVQSQPQTAARQDGTKVKSDASRIAQEAPRVNRDYDRNQSPARIETVPRQEPAAQSEQPRRPEPVIRQDQAPRIDQEPRQDQAPRIDQADRSAAQPQSHVSSFDRLMADQPATAQAAPNTVAVEAPVVSFPQPVPADDYEPIISPSHIELSHLDEPAPSGTKFDNEVPAMADFAAAAQFLRRDDQAPGDRPKPTQALQQHQEKPQTAPQAASKPRDETIDKSGDYPIRDRTQR